MHGYWIGNTSDGRRSKHLRRGITMFEFILGLFLLVLCLLAIFSGSVMAAKVALDTQARTVATSIARRQMEAVIANSQGNRMLVTNEPFEIPGELLLQFPGAISSDTTVNGTYSVESIPDNKNLERISVRVSWIRPSSFGQAKTTSLSLTKVVCSIQNMNNTSYNGQDPVDPTTYFYTPPPPPPPAPLPPPGGSTGGTGGGSSSSSSSGGGGSSSSGGGGGGSTSTDGSTTGGTTGGGSSGGTTIPGIDGSYGYKW